MKKSFLPAALFALLAGNVVAAGYPERPITVVVALAAGGATDISTRIVGKYLSVPLGQQIIVDNRGGGGGMIAASAVMRAKRIGSRRRRIPDFPKRLGSSL